MRQVVFILGMHRCGGSVVGGALAAAGAHPGSALVPPIDPASDRWECSTVRALNDQLLAAAGSRWDSLSPLPPRWAEAAPVQRLLPKLADVVRSEFAGAGVALIKDPRVSFLFPVWRLAFEEAGYTVAVAVVLRRPTEALPALAKQHGFAPEKALALWLAHLTAAERSTRGMTRSVVSFDALRSDAAGVLGRLAATGRLGFLKEADRLAAATAFAQAALKRHPPLPANANRAHLVSGLDQVLDQGYAALASTSGGIDLRRELDALERAAQAPLNAAMPPWIAQELATERVVAQRHAAELDAALHRSHTLGRELETAHQALAAGERADKEMRARLEMLETQAQETADQSEAERQGSHGAFSTRVDSLQAALEDKLANAHSELARLAAAVEEAPRREAMMRRDLLEAQRDLADERGTIVKLTDELDQLRAIAIAQSSDVEQAREHLATMTAEVEHAATFVRARDHELQIANQETGELRAQFTAAQNEREAFRKERDAAVRQHEQMRRELDAARSDIAATHKEAAALSAAVAQTGEALAALREELARRTAAEASLNGDLRVATERNSALEREVTQRNADFAALAGRYEVLAKSMSELEQRWPMKMARVLTGGKSANG